MLDLSLFTPLAFVAALFVLVVVGIVVVLRVTLARGIARSRAGGPVPIVAPAESESAVERDAQPT